jgi:hypothetical protein
LNPDWSKAYELLGVKPGVSSRELKAAHRDLAKVWHPDRFGHDPRLQQKAQEKLKEINEAYDLLSSGKTPRPAPTPPPRPVEKVYYTASEPQRSAPSGGSSKWAVVVVLTFLAVFAVTTKVLLDRRSKPQPQPQQETESVQVEAATRTEPAARNEAARKPTHTDSVPEAPAVVSDTSSAPTPALATVTVLIDPESRLLAKPDCPVRSRMTYPSGSQPSAYCNINHAPPPKDSKIKALKDKILH